jgi:hypothetical protein
MSHKHTHVLEHMPVTLPLSYYKHTHIHTHTNTHTHTHTYTHTHVLISNTHTQIHTDTDTRTDTDTDTHDTDTQTQTHAQTQTQAHTCPQQRSWEGAQAQLRGCGSWPPAPYSAIKAAYTSSLRPRILVAEDPIHLHHTQPAVLAT